MTWNTISTLRSWELCFSAEARRFLRLEAPFRCATAAARVRFSCR